MEQQDRTNPQEKQSGEPIATRKPSDASKDSLAEFAGNLLDRVDSLIYAIVGVCFLIAALGALGYSFWDFNIHLRAAIVQTTATNVAVSAVQAQAASASVASAIIQFVSDLLLVIIIMEVLGTIVHYLKSHTTSLRPFLFIGIVSATRGILSIGARLSVEHVSGADFTNAMIELGVNAAVILALGITLNLLGKFIEDHLEKN